MAESSWPTVAGSHAISDTQWELMAQGFAADGVIGLPTDTAVVYADSTGLQVKIRAGKYGLVKGHGWQSGTAEFTKAITANNSGQTRIDLVVLRFNRTDQTVTVQVKAGTPGSGAAPALQQDASSTGAGLYEIGLAKVTVATGASTISSGNVVPVTKFIVPGGVAYARPKLLVMTHPDGLNGSWNNTSAPADDSPTATGNSQTFRLTIDKQSPDSNLEVAISTTGYTNGQGKVITGVRVMASGFTSTNYNVGELYFNSSAMGHLNVGGTLHIPNLAAKTYTIQLWFFTSGVSFIQDFNDQCMLRIAEV